MLKTAFTTLSLALLLTGCDQLNNQINKPARDAKATGAGCRLSGRSLEDCYKRNPRAARAEVYAGWKEMNDYMAKQKIAEIAPPPDEPKPAPVDEEETAKDKAGDKADGKKGDAKPESKADAAHGEPAKPAKPAAGSH